MADAAAPPPGLPTDTRSGVMIGILSFLLPFTTLFVALRFYARHFITNSIGIDDWVSLGALILAIVDGTVMGVMTTTGLGHHIWTLTPAQLKRYYMLFYVSIVVYNGCLGLIKMALLLQYLRVFAHTMRKVTIGAMVVIGMWCVALVILSIFNCHPIEGFWDRSVNATCIPLLPQWYINAAGNIATDLVIFALPIPVLWKLQLPKSQRLSLVGIFSLGFFTCAISVIRIPSLNLNGDDTYGNVNSAGWSIGELCCGIVCSCLPTLRPLFWRLIPTQLRSSKGGTGGKYNRSYGASGGSAVKTIGGGIVSGAKSQKSQGTRATQNSVNASSIPRGTSQDELTRPEDFEMEVGLAAGAVAGEKGRVTPGVDELRNSSSESIIGLSSVHENAARVQKPLPLAPAGAGFAHRAHLHKKQPGSMDSSVNRDEFTGLQQAGTGTFTSIKASPVSQPGSPTTGRTTVGGTGIQIRTEFVQKVDAAEEQVKPAARKPATTLSSKFAPPVSPFPRTQ